MTDDAFVVAGEKLGSRLILGTGGAPSMQVVEEVIAASGTAMCTVSMRRVDPTITGSVLDVLARPRRPRCCRTPPAAAPPARRC